MELGSKRNFRITIIILIFVVLTTGPTRSQCNKMSQILQAIDLNRRSELAKDIDSVIDLQRTHQWDKLYPILPSDYTQGESKYEYVRRHKQYKGNAIENNFLNFVPSRIGRNYHTVDAEVWVIEGCGEWRYENRKLRQFAYVKAYWKDQRWFLTEVLFDLPLHSGFISCPDE